MTLKMQNSFGTKTDGTKYDFNRFSLPLKFIKRIYNYEITLNEAMNNQTESKILINKLNNGYNPRNTEKVKEKNRVLKSARKLSDARDEIIIFFEKGIFPYNDNTLETKEKENSEEEPKEELEENKFFKYIENESEGINDELFKDYFDSVGPNFLAKELFETKKKKNKNSEFVELMNVRWSNLKDEIKKMSKEEIENEKPDKILKIVE